MVEEVITPTEPAVEPTAPAEVPVAPEPVITADPTPEAPEVAPEAPIEPTPEVDATLLGTETTPEPKVDTPPVEGVEEKTPEGETKTVEGQSDEPAPLPTYEPFELPEGFTLDEERIGDVTTLLGEFEQLTKADHAEVQKLGQALMDRHIAEVQGSIERLNQSYLDAFENQKNEWKERFISDPEIGGNRQNTTVSSALEFIRTHGGTTEQQAEFKQLMDQTGVGNHPAMIRMLANAMHANAEGGPIPASRPIPEVKSKVDKRYGGNL